MNDMTFQENQENAQTGVWSPDVYPPDVPATVEMTDTEETAAVMVEELGSVAEEPAAEELVAAESLESEVSEEATGETGTAVQEEAEATEGSVSELPEESSFVQEVPEAVEESIDELDEKSSAMLEVSEATEESTDELGEESSAMQEVSEVTEESTEESSAMQEVSEATEESTDELDEESSAMLEVSEVTEESTGELPEDSSAESEEPAPAPAKQTPASQAALLEAILYLEGNPVDEAGLVRISGLSHETVKVALGTLAEKYEREDSGIELSYIGGGIMLSPKKGHWETLRERYGKKNEAKLSRAAMETLSIIAYSQPITRSEIEAIRGVQADNMIRLLLEKELVHEVGKKDVPGKPTMFGTTKEFLKLFRIASIADLPKLNKSEAERFELEG